MAVKHEKNIQILFRGTFDKSHNFIGVALYFKKAHLPEMLKISRCLLDIKVETLMMMDSLKIGVK